MKFLLFILLVITSFSQDTCSVIDFEETMHLNRTASLNPFTFNMDLLYADNTRVATMTNRIFKSGDVLELSDLDGNMIASIKGSKSLFSTKRSIEVFDCNNQLIGHINRESSSLFQILSNDSNSYTFKDIQSQKNQSFHAKANQSNALSHIANWQIEYNQDSSYNSNLAFLFLPALRSSSLGAYKAQKSKDLNKKKARFLEIYGEE
ncbi:MAG: hypothetical protein KC646_00115 [Candidatus Cloacimonetes bacterium]|nr:hypothetical protein [Candidatus Cloacimonadota bacterium]